MQDAGLFINTITPTSGFFVLCFLLFVVLVMLKKPREAIIFSVALCLTTLTVVVLKLSFAVERPQDALLVLSTYAFPSGHAASAMFMAVMLTWLYLKRKNRDILRTTVVLSALISMAFFVGYSRIVIGVHTPLQVLAGFAVGALIPMLCIYCFSPNSKLFLWLRKIFPTL